MLKIISKRKSTYTAAMLAFGLIPAQASIIIDSFTTPQGVAVPARPPSQATLQGSTVANSIVAPFAIGGEREMYYRRLFGTAGGRLNVNQDDFEAASFSTGTNGVANALLVYDGPDSNTTLNSIGAVPVTNAANMASANTKVSQFRFGAPNTMGLGGQDLTEDGQNDRIRLAAYADNQGVEIVFRFFLTANKYAQAVLEIPGSENFAYAEYDVLYTDFTAVGFGAGESVVDAFRATNAITVQLNGVESTDASFDFLQSTTGVPEPFTTSLTGFGLIFLGSLKLRRKVQ